MYGRCHHAGEFSAMYPAFAKFGHQFYRKFGKGHLAKRFWQFSGSVPINMKENETAYEIEVYAPGYSKEEIKLSVKNDTLLIKGEAKDKPQEFKYHEFPPKSFEREIPLNNSVIVEEISASFKHGTLFITLPKTPEAQKPPVKVEIK